MNDLLKGHIEKRKVRCGKTNCKCAGGESHTAYYHVWYQDGMRFREYVRKSKLEKVRASCLNYRNLQIQLRIGRAEYKQLIKRARFLIKIGML